TASNTSLKLAIKEVSVEGSTPTETGAGSARDDYLALASLYAEKAGLPLIVSHAVMEIESGFNPSVRGADGEVGLMQVMPPTAHMLGFRGTLEELAVPETNIALGVRYLAEAHRLANGDLCTTVMKYRAGHGETRFSALSVAYCRRARDILKRAGEDVSAVVIPAATFGFEGGGAKRLGSMASGGCVRRSFVPGPNYGRCVAKGSGKVAVAARRALFGG
ncbi:MAG: lytic transglycosylase domain-containing protein, partial [Notoacmeibacter sp.]